MSTVEERLKILNMVAEGKIAAEEGARLLSALEETERSGAPSTPNGPDAAAGSAEARSLRIRVYNCQSGRDKINVRIPINLVSVALRMGARFTSDVDGIEVEDVVKAIRQGARGKIVDVTDAEGDERIEIYVE
jgi:hypothetical protein